MDTSIQSLVSCFLFRNEEGMFDAGIIFTRSWHVTDVKVMTLTLQELQWIWSQRI